MFQSIYDAFCYTFYSSMYYLMGAPGGVVAKALRYKQAGTGSIPDGVICVALWPGGRLSL